MEPGGVEWVEIRVSPGGSAAGRDDYLPRGS